MEPSSASSASSPTTMMVVTAVLTEFYQLNNNNTNVNPSQPQLLADSCKILVQLIRNALNNNDTKFRRVRLANPRIQSRVVQVPGALDVLSVAGFERLQEGEESVVLFSMNDGQGNESPAQQQQQQAEVCLALCHGLETKRSELLASLQTQHEENKVVHQPQNNNPFLSEEERARRRKAAQKAKQAKRAERSKALAAWKEDEEDRKLKASRREAAMQMQSMEESSPPSVASARAADLVPQIRIQKLPQAQEAKNEEEDVEMGKETPSNKQNDEKEEPGSPASENAPVANLKSNDEDAMDTSVVHDEETDKAKEQHVDTSSLAEAWKLCLATVPRCAPASGIRDTSVFTDEDDNTTRRSPSSWKYLLQENESMKESLPSDPGCTIFVRFDEDSPHFLRALVPAAIAENSHTPYAGGVFVFDIYLPPRYPQVPPKVQLITTGGGTVRFGPNLYACGKVCLSLLGTWEGPKWLPGGRSTLTQVLVSIQGLILGAEHPFYLEPGHGGWEGDVKEGDFAVTGHTLAGGSVQQDVVPLPVAVYENDLRVGTLRFALLELIRWSCGGTNDDSEDVSLPPYLEAFARPLQLHFYHNRDRIVQEWKGGHGAAQAATGMLANKGKATPMYGNEMSSQQQEGKQMQLLKQISALAEKVETELAALPGPSDEVPEPVAEAAVRAPASVVPEDESSSDNEEAEEDTKPAAKPFPQVPMATRSHDKNTKDDSASTVISDIRQQMQDVAAAGDYIRAGQLQQSLASLEDLQTRMQQAATQGDFIRAGRLQEQLNARAATARVEAQNADEETTDDQQPHHDHEMSYDDDFGDPQQDDDDEVFEGDEGDEDYDDGWDSHNHQAAHSWGSGTALKATSSASAANKKAKTTNVTAAAAPAVPPYQSERSSGVLCRLRIRLPAETNSASSSTTEQFDGTDRLSDLYKHVEKFLSLDEEPQEAPKTSAVAKSAHRKQVMGPYGPEMVPESAFSRPLSLKGFTLLLAHPKKEFSLEMHGTQTLQELGLVPSATLTVMMCQDRGVVKRGDLESRLNEAQGDAMDVDGLSYEGLLELTERVGTSNTWNKELADNLESRSTLLSPKEFLSSKKAPAAAASGAGSSTTSNIGRCPICLGEFDEAETEKSLRQLHSCGHTFHVACLDTWLQTKKACPMCNQDIV